MYTIGSTIETITTIGIIIFSVSYTYTQLKSAKSKQVEDANDKLSHTLNELVATQDKKIDELKKEWLSSQQKIKFLEGRVEELSRKNTDLQDIISVALDRFFSAHPEEAIRLAKQTSKQVTTPYDSSGVR